MMRWFALSLVAAACGVLVPGRLAVAQSQLPQAAIAPGSYPAAGPSSLAAPWQPAAWTAPSTSPPAYSTWTPPPPPPPAAAAPLPATWQPPLRALPPVESVAPLQTHAPAPAAAPGQFWPYQHSTVAPPSAPAPAQNWTLGDLGQQIGTAHKGLVARFERPAGKWFAGLYGLVMTRDGENKVWLSYDTANIRSRVLTSRDADAGYAGGFETRFGRTLGCNRAWEIVYWGIFPETDEGNVRATDVVIDLDTILHFDGISYDPGGAPQLVSTAFFQAERHRVQRSYQLHNVEYNVLGNNYVPGCCGAGKGCGDACGGGGRVCLGWAVGVRYLQFDDDFLYSADPSDVTFSGAPDEIHYAIDVENNLLGLQLGARADVNIWRQLNSFVDTKVGVYSNWVKHRSRIFGSNGAAEVSDVGSPFFGNRVDVSSTKNDVALIGELRLGLDWQINPCWSVTVGYRAVALSGVALSTNQIPVDFIAALDSLKHVDTNGSLIAHGGFAGVEFNY